MADVSEAAHIGTLYPDNDAMNENDQGILSTIVHRWHAARGPLSKMPSNALGDLALICGAFASIAFLNKDWLVNRIGSIDKWMYTEYFLHYNYPFVLYWDKKIARLPWILSGFVVNQLFSPMLATKLLHGGYFLLLCVGIYFVGSKLFNRSFGLLLGLFSVFYAELYGSGGWDYHNTAAGAFYVFAYLAIIYAAERQDRVYWHFFAAGILVALTIHTNIIAINVLPVAVLQVVFQLKKRNFDFATGRPWIGKGLLGVISGAIACTIVLGLINVAFGREFLFFMKLIARSEMLLSSPEMQRAWWAPWGTYWWAIEPHMAMYVVVLFLSFAYLVALFVKRRPFWNDVSNVVFAEYAIAALVMLGWQLLGQTSLQPGYMSYPLTFPMLFALGGLVFRTLPSVDESKYTIVSWLAALLFILYSVFATGIERRWFFFQPDDLRDVQPIFVFMAGYLIILFLVKRAAFTRLGPAPKYGIVFLALSFTLAATDKQLARIDDFAVVDPCVTGTPVYSSVVAASRFIFPYVVRSNQNHLKLWFDSDEELGETNCGRRLAARLVGRPIIYGGFGSIMEWYEMAPRSMDIPDKRIRAVDPKSDVVAVLSENPEIATELIGRLNQFNSGKWKIINSKKFHEGAIKFSIFIIASQEMKFRSKD